MHENEWKMHESRTHSFESIGAVNNSVSWVTKNGPRLKLTRGTHLFLVWMYRHYYFANSEVRPTSNLELARGRPKYMYHGHQRPQHSRGGDGSRGSARAC